MESFISPLYASSYNTIKSDIALTQAGRRCGSLAADNRHLPDAKLMGRPVPETSSFEISKMADFMTSLLSLRTT